MGPLHERKSTPSPTQAPPGAVGAGAVQLRTRVCTPPLPHVTELLDQLLHADQLPFTARAKRSVISSVRRTPKEAVHRTNGLIRYRAHHK